MNKVKDNSSSRKSSMIQPGKTPDKRSKVKQNITDFARNSTTHGVAYIFEENVRHVSRLVWLVITLGLVILSVVMIGEAYRNWVRHPVLTTMESTASPVDTVEFPAITICGMGNVDKVIDKVLGHQFRQKLKENGVNVTEDDSASTRTLVKSYGLEHLQQLYPGLQSEKSGRMLSELLSTLNPNEFLKGRTLIGINEEGSSLYNNDDDDDDEEEEDKCFFKKDTESQICYEYNSAETTLKIAKSYCQNRNNFELFYLRDNKQLETLAELIKAGLSNWRPSELLCVARDYSITRLSVTNYNDIMNNRDKFNDTELKTFPTLVQGNVYQSVWTDLKKRDDGSLYLESAGIDFNITEFPMIQLAERDSRRKTCFTMRWSAEQGRFWVDNSLCTDKNGLFCMKSTAKGFGSDEKGGKKKKRNLLDLLIKPEERQHLQDYLENEKAKLIHQFNLIDTRQSYSNFFELLWYSQLPCFDSSRFSDFPNQKSLLKTCYWKSKRIPCSSLFRTYPTDRGMCCTFNLQDANKMLTPSNFSSSITRLQERDRREAFDYQQDLPDWYLSNQEPTAQAGINNGLTVLLDAHTNILKSSSVGDNFDGFIATVGPPLSYPVTSQNHIKLRPGHENLVAISAEAISVTEDFQSNLDVADRKCFFPDEMKILSHQHYSQASCLIECQLNSTIKRMQLRNKTRCVPWYLPVMENTSFCNPWLAQDFRRALQYVPASECGMCLPDCQSTVYSTSVTAVPFKRCDNKNIGISMLCDLENANLPTPGIFGSQIWKQYDNPVLLPTYANRFTKSQRFYSSLPQNEIFSRLYEDDDYNVYEAYDKDIALVHFYFGSPTVYTYRRQPSMTWVDFLSQVGGLLGLCIGFSICSGIETIYWLGFRIWCNLKIKKVHI